MDEPKTKRDESAAGEQVVVEGEVASVLYENPDNGYAVVRLVRSDRAPVTVTGSLYGLSRGQRVRVAGRYREHPRFGRQLQAERHEEILPRAREGMVAFLASRFRGIGPKLAERIVDTFGERTYDILDEDPRAIARVPGVGRKRAEEIAEQWHERRAIREAATFLQAHGVGPGQVTRVFRHFGDATVALVRENPYRLADEVKGIGFRTADRIARSLGIPPDAPERAQAAALHLLHEALSQGHLLLPRAEVVRRAAAFEIEADAMERAIDELAAARLVVVEEEPPAECVSRLPEGAAWDRRGPAVYLPEARRQERIVAGRVARLARPRPEVPRLRERVDAIAARQGLRLEEEQREAVATALAQGFSVVTGGPGVGKTTIVRCIVEAAEARRERVLLAAPTGRAAKRLSESCGRPASTIHRLLKFDPFRGAFAHDARDPLEADHVVVDEASMVDVPLAASLLEAVPPAARVTLVGDADQLPSVGPGDLLRSLVACGRVPVVRLERVFRQAEGSRIVEGAHAVRRGEMPAFDPPGRGGEFYFVSEEDAQRVAAAVRRLVAERIPKVYGFDPRTEVQTLTPMHRGPAGAENLNALLGEALNPNPPALLERGARRFAVGDRVVQTRNDYDKGIFNGDQGFVVAVDRRAGRLRVRFDDREVELEGEDLAALLPAWATTVHRAQGSEVPAVVFAITAQAYPLLRRNLVYTAITRAKRLCVIVGSRRALARAIRTESTHDRFSWLEERLVAAFSTGSRT